MYIIPSCFSPRERLVKIFFMEKLVNIIIYKLILDYLQFLKLNDKLEGVVVNVSNYFVDLTLASQKSQTLFRPILEKSLNKKTLFMIKYIYDNSLKDHHFQNILFGSIVTFKAMSARGQLASCRPVIGFWLALLYISIPLLVKENKGFSFVNLRCSTKNLNIPDTTRHHKK